MQDAPGDPYEGMTTNERLFSAGLLNQFDRAERQRNRAEMIVLLARVGFSTQEAESIADIALRYSP